MSFQVFDRKPSGSMKPVLERERATAAECFAFIEQAEEQAGHELLEWGVYRSTGDGGWEEVLRNGRPSA